MRITVQHAGVVWLDLTLWEREPDPAHEAAMTAVLERREEWPQDTEIGFR